jgi:hypothetical protein
MLPKLLSKSIYMWYTSSKHPWRQQVHLGLGLHGHGRCEVMVIHDDWMIFFSTPILGNNHMSR